MKHRAEPRVLPMREPLPELGPISEHRAHVWWQLGRDTEEIRIDLGVDEAAVYNSLSRIRQRQYERRHPGRAVVWDEEE